MRNRLLLASALFVFSGMVFTSCNKEKIPPPTNTKQNNVTANSKSENPSSSSSTESSNNNHPSGCGHGG